MAKWLTQKEKIERLKNLEGDLPQVDPEMIPWLEKFNALPGIVTRSSCIGHPERDRWDYNPYLTLRTTRKRALQIIDSVGDRLVDHPSCFLELQVDYNPYSETSVRLETTAEGTFLAMLATALEELSR